MHTHTHTLTQKHKEQEKERQQVSKKDSWRVQEKEWTNIEEENDSDRKQNDSECGYLRVGDLGLSENAELSKKGEESGKMLEEHSWAY